MLYLIQKFLDKQKFGAARSGKWSQVRHNFLKSHPECACCGRTDKLEVHHIEPFNVAPEKELDYNNLITLCRTCHLLIGHLNSFQSWNREVKQDADYILNKIKNRP